MKNYFETRFKFNNSRRRVWKAISEYINTFIPQEAKVLELGAGYCDFINTIKAKEKIAVDYNEKSKEFADKDVDFHNDSVTNLSFVKSSSMDLVFASNLYEHLTDDDAQKSLNEVYRVLKTGGQIVLMQPNYKYAFADYFDDFTHRKVYSHISLADLLLTHNFNEVKIIPRFLPFSLKSRLPKSYLLTKLFIMSPFKPFAKQMLLIFKK